VLWHDIANLITDYGLLVVAVVIGLESIGLPFPGESVLILAGIFAGTQHQLNIFWVVVVAAVAAIVGQAIGYLVGREFGYRLLLRYGPYVRVTESRIKLGEYLFLRHGRKIIVVARFVPLLRSLAGILAFAWAGVFGFAAYFLGHEVEHVAGPVMIGIGIVAVVVLAIGANFVGKHEAQLAAEAERALPGPLK
jgi:membrane protein DedA with SNARE-associated domain